MGRILEKGKVTMKTRDFLKKHDACIDGAKWALSIGEDMVDVWDAMIEQGKHDWLIWTATRPGVFPDSTLRKLACRFVRKTPLHDGRKVWDLLIDERSRKAVEVAEAYADGKATYEELQTAYTAADAAADAAYAAAYDAACNAAYAAVFAAAYDAACNAAYAAVFAAADAADAAYAARAARVAAYAAADDAAEAAYDAAYDVAEAQMKMIAELGNPFKERTGK
jgi:hypothetical protein